MSDADSSRTGFQTVVVGVDGRAGGRDAIALAVALLSPSGRLILTSVVRPWGAVRLGALFADADRQAAAQMLDAERDRLDCACSTSVVVSSSVATALHSVAEKHHADLLVVGSPHRGPLGRVTLGDDARGALDGARCAVAIARRDPGRSSSWQAIAVGDDGSAESALALDIARRLASRTGARIRACSVVGPASLTYRQLARMDPSAAFAGRIHAEKKRLREYGDVEPTVLEGDPGEALAELGREVDLLIIGSRGQGAWGRLMTGSTGEYLAHHAACPVLILPRGLDPSGAARVPVASGADR